MTESIDSSRTGPTPFQEKLMTILREEYGNKNVIVESDYDMTVYYRDRVVKVTVGNDFAVMYSCLTDEDKSLFTIPVDEVFDYASILADLPWFQPALYRTVSKVNYVPHYPMCIYSQDVENRECIMMVVNNLSAMAGYSSDILRKKLSDIKKKETTTLDVVDSDDDFDYGELEDEDTDQSE